MSIINIKEYMYEIFEDFIQYVENAKVLCHIKKVHFKDSHFPAYNKEQVQQIYLLRYAFAYIFEYKHMYKTLFSNAGKYFFDIYKNKNGLKILSIGCGAMLDYIGLKYCLSDFELSDFPIIYAGVDPIDWKYKPRNINEVYFYNKNINEIIQTNNEIKSDILFFPKSISEIKIEEIINILHKVKNEDFYIFISYRCNNQDDKNKIESICDYIKSSNLYLTLTYSSFPNSRIETMDSSFTYPDDIKIFLRNLPNKCKEIFLCPSGNNCNNYLGRKPMSNASNLAYVIIRCEEVPF